MLTLATCYRANERPEAFWLDAEIGPAPLEIVISRSPGAVRGVVQSADPRAAQYAWVSVVPSAPHRDNLNLYKGVRADAQGRFSIAGIVPGQYKLFAFDGVPYFAGANPGFISRYEIFGRTDHHY